jgi:hypothetical protein
MNWTGVERTNRRKFSRERPGTRQHRSECWWSSVLMFSMKYPMII